MPDVRVLRFEVPVDDRWHAHFAGPIVHVDCRRPDVVEFWALTDEDDDIQRWFRVFGTGHQAHGKYLGTALTPVHGPSGYGALVWHLFEEHPMVIARRGETRA